MPGLKASAAEAGAPDGFVDVVAQLQPIADGDDTPPHWDVTFATDDVEATAALASELGAEVLHGPVDAPWVRHAVIRDPQGATFIASQFVPERTEEHTSEHQTLMRSSYAVYCFNKTK